MSTELLTRQSFTPVAGADTLVQQSLHTIYSAAGDQALYAVIETHLVSTDWVKLFSWRNSSNTEDKHTAAYTTELKVIEGSELSVEVGIGAELKGLSLSMSVGSKTFNSTETTETRSWSTEVTVEPRATVSFYQQRFKLETRVWFILDAWGKEWTVGSWESDAPCELKCVTEVMSQDYAKVLSELTGQGSLTVTAATRKYKKENQSVRRYNDCTSRCQSTLKRLGA